MEKSRKITLSEPVMVGDKEITEVVIRRATVGDEEDAMQKAIGMKRGNNSITLELCLFSRLTRLTYDVLRNMDGDDYRKIRNAHNELMGMAREENPTQTDLTLTAD